MLGLDVLVLAGLVLFVSGVGGLERLRNTELFYQLRIANPKARKMVTKLWDWCC